MFTCGQDKNSVTWTGKVRGSLGQLDRSDGRFLEQLLLSQNTNAQTYPCVEQGFRKLIGPRIRRGDRVVSVSVPEESRLEPPSSLGGLPEVRESTKIQALIADIGARMGMSIWLPFNDKAAVLAEWRAKSLPVLDRLPSNYDESTLRTIEQIDVP